MNTTVFRMCATCNDMRVFDYCPERIQENGFICRHCKCFEILKETPAVRHVKEDLGIIKSEVGLMPDEDRDITKKEGRVPEKDLKPQYTIKDTPEPNFAHITCSCGHSFMADPDLPFACVQCTKEEKPKADPLETQVGGDHYSRMKIQPIEYIQANDLGFEEGNIVKYVTRHKFKNGAEDIKKIKHYCDLLLKRYEDV